MDFKGDAQFEIASGPKATVGTSFLGETLDASVEAQIGAKVTAETSSEAGTSDKERHACRVCLSGKATVSYTHLDVYKRQAWDLWYNRR